MSITISETKRKIYDLYSTPPYTIESILNIINLKKVNSLSEPCPENSAIYDLINYNIVPMKHFTKITMRLNYFNLKFNVNLIITHTPFNITKEFFN